METAAAQQIKASELRIDNWLICNGGGINYVTGEPTFAPSLSPSFHQWSAEDFFVSGRLPKYMQLYEPIPLTQDLLEKCGFEKDNIDNLDGWVKKGRLSIFLEPVQCEDGRTDWYTYIEFNVAMGFNHLVTSPPYYVHELQNLHFILTGRELQINL